MRKIQLYVVFCLVILMAGCTGKPALQVRNNFVDSINARLREAQADTSKEKRNQAIEYVVAIFDANYEDFVRSLESKRSRVNFVADVVELGTSAAIGITKGSQRTIQIMGIALTAFRGGRKAADLNFFREQTTAVLISKMDARRAQVYAGILQRMNEDINSYSMQSAVRDIVAYYNAGTLVRAFTELAKDTASEAQRSENKVLELKGILITSEAREADRNLSVSAQNLLAGLDTDLGSTDAAKVAAATKKLQRIVAVLEKDKAAAEALKNAGVSSKDDGPKLADALTDIRNAARLVNNNALLNTINQAIIDNAT